MQTRLFVPCALYEGAAVELSGSQLHYLKNVLRASVGDTVFAFNGIDGEFSGTVDVLNKKNACIRIRNLTKKQEFPAPVRLFFTPLKRDCSDLLIEKATELGVTELHPVLTDFTAINRTNADRMQNIVVEACAQSRRLSIPEIYPITPLQSVLNEWSEKNGLLLHLDESGDGDTFKRAVGDIAADDAVSFLIGPEGGFSPEERERLKKMPFVRSVSLGEHILRAETAGIAVLAAFLCR